jgi:redox-sensing transcriptional repressor
MTPMRNVPDTTVERLPAYLRYLSQASKDGIRVVSSSMIALSAGTNAAQVRKDLSFLGALGTRGRGYDPVVLAAHLTGLMGLRRPRRVAIVGYGRLGGALLNYLGQTERGFRVVALIDVDPGKVGTSVAGLAVSPLDDLEKVLVAGRVEVVMLTTPAPAAQATAERIARAGITAVLNFAPTVLDLPRDVAVRNVDLSAEMQVLAFRLENARVEQG